MKKEITTKDQHFQSAEDLLDYFKHCLGNVVYWTQGGGNYASWLYTMFLKADALNDKKLEAAYPIERTALAVWEANEPDYFEKWVIENCPDIDDCIEIEKTGNDFTIKFPKGFDFLTSRT